MQQGALSSPETQVGTRSLNLLLDASNVCSALELLEGLYEFTKRNILLRDVFHLFKVGFYSDLQLLQVGGPELTL